MNNIPIMGCINSNSSARHSDGHSGTRTTNKSDIVEEFIRLDKQIEKREISCPVPRLATVEAYIQHLKVIQNSLQVDDTGQEHEHDTPKSNPIVYNTANVVPGSPPKDLAKLALSLGVIADAQIAVIHEDFFAKLNETELRLISTQYLSEILDHMGSRMKSLMQNFDELNELYLRIDSLFATISGGTYVTRLEESLDAQLESARDVRDKLGSAMEQWRICGLLLQTAAKSAKQSLESWTQITKLRDSPSRTILTAFECRNTIQASLTSLEYGQISLPNLEIKHISNRQTLAVKHVITYMITDIADESRFDHATKVLETYESNVQKASFWLQDTFKQTLRKDFENAQITVENLSKILRDHRYELFMEIRQNR